MYDNEVGALREVHNFQMGYMYIHLGKVSAIRTHFAVLLISVASREAVCRNDRLTPL